MTVIVKKIGGSMAVVIPKAMAGELDLMEGTSLEISSNSDSIVLRKQGRRPRRPLTKLLAGINPASYARHNREFSKETPVGKEIW